MRYISTRGGASPVMAGQAILKGLAEDGGLYVPEEIPAFSKPLHELLSLSYAEMAYAILQPYLTDYSEIVLRNAVQKAYAYPDKFDTPVMAPLVKHGNHYFLELYHGRTLAFKDMALSLLPYLLTAAAEKYRPGVKTLVLTATSGDTGKAALESFAQVDGILVAVFFPEEGVSATQKKQMVTQEGNNTFVCGVRGNFDNTQTGVKQIFSDLALAEDMKRAGLVFSSANSINIGRLLPQIVYYVYAYAQLVQQGAVKIGDKVDFTVPTGNFGNILAGYYARRMGLPLRKLICASNRNNILYDFFQTGMYDINRPFYTTASPSMDILISSNLERLLFHTAQDTQQVAQCMTTLASEGRYDFNAAFPGFASAYATEEETFAAMQETAQTGYLTDPHTAVAYHACKQHMDAIPNIILSTASPFKFAENVCAAAFQTPQGDTADLSRLSGLAVPQAITALEDKKIRHTSVCEVDGMKQWLLDSVIFPQDR